MVYSWTPADADVPSRAATQSVNEDEGGRSRHPDGGEIPGRVPDPGMVSILPEGPILPSAPRPGGRGDTGVGSPQAPTPTTSALRVTVKDGPEIDVVINEVNID